MQNMFNPYGNLYGTGGPVSYPTVNIQNPFVNNSQIGDQLLKVNGIEGARAFLTKPNSTIALFDANEDIMYIKTTDSANFPVIKCYSFTEVKEDNAQNVSYVTEDDLTKFKEEVIKDVKQLVQQRKYTGESSSNSKSKRSE